MKIATRITAAIPNRFARVIRLVYPFLRLDHVSSFRADQAGRCLWVPRNE
jgi:hypothetical protein